MNLRFYPEEILHTKCIVVPTTHWNTKYYTEIIRNMGLIMRDYGGVGLSANQVGLTIRIFVWLQNQRCQAIINPQLTCLSGETEKEEGCLSLPEIVVKKRRALSSKLIGLGVNGRPLQFIGDATTTRIWQHEIDHLDGKLIIDDMTEEDVKKNMLILKRLSLLK